jgi:hypothetical protein
MCYVRNIVCTCMRNSDSNRHSHNAHLFSSLECTHVRLSKIHPCTHELEFSDHLRTRGSTLTKFPVRSSIQPLQKNKILITMQEDPTTNLTLAEFESTDSISQNLQISPQNSHPITLAIGTNEVALWALQLYIVPFVKLPGSILGALGNHFSFCLQPRDHYPTTYTISFPRTLSIIIAQGAFSHITLRYTCSCSKLSNNYYMFFIFRYCSHRVFWFSCVQVLGHHTPTQPLQVYDQHWHVIIPCESQLHLQSHPPSFSFRVPISVSAVLSPLLHFGTATR